jgi:hypothetical protein
MLLGTERVISEMSGGECRFSPDTNDFGTTQAILCAVLLSQAGNEAIAYEDLIPDKDGGAVYILWNNQLVQYEEFMHKDGNGVTVIKSINGVEISRGKANDFLVPDQDFPILARMGPQKAMELYEELFSGGSKKFIGHVEWGGRIVFAGRPMFLKKTESKTKSKTENETKKVFSLNRSSDGELVHTLIPGKNPIPEYHAEIFISELGVRVYGLKGSENILVDNSLASLRDIAETLKSELEGSVLRPVANMERNGAMQARKTIERLRKLYHDIETDALPDVLAVGDQHGDNNVLAHMLELVKEGRLAENAMIVLKGDEFDRGDNNRENFSCMKELKRLLGGRVVYCLGNHNIILVLTVLFKDLVMELQFYNPWVR